MIYVLQGPLNSLFPVFYRTEEFHLIPNSFMHKACHQKKNKTKNKNKTELQFYYYKEGKLTF